MSVTDHAMRYMLAAVRAFGTDVLSGRPAADSGLPEPVGRELFRLIFADRAQPDDLDRQLAALARDPDDDAAQDMLEGLVSEAIDDDQGVAHAVLEMLTVFYQRQGHVGNTQALADLGDMLYWEDDFDGAKAAYQQAISAGRHEALIGMAFLYRRAGAARACLDQAMTVGDPGLTAQALVTLGTVGQRSGRRRVGPAAGRSDGPSGLGGRRDGRPRRPAEAARR